MDVPARSDPARSDPVGSDPVGSDPVGPPPVDYGPGMPGSAAVLAAAVLAADAGRTGTGQPAPGDRPGNRLPDPPDSPMARAAAVAVAVAVRRAGLVLLAALLLTAAALITIANRIGINTDTTDMLAPELPFRQDAKALSAAFPQHSGMLAIVVDGATADLADDAAAALAARLAGDPVFTSVSALVSDPFFRRNGLLYPDTDRVHAIADRLAAAQPFMATLAQDRSLAALVGLLRQAIRQATDPAKDPATDPATDPASNSAAAVDLAAAMERIAAVIQAQADGRPDRLSWRAMLGGGAAADPAGTVRQIVQAQPIRDFGSLQPAKHGIQVVRAAVAELGFDTDPQVRVRITGNAALADEELRSVRDGMGLAGILSMTLVIGLLLIGLRSVRLALATLITLGLGLVWTAGFAAAAVGELNLISVAFAVLFIGLGVDFGIHFGLRTREGLDAGFDHVRALVRAGASCGGSLTLCAVAAAIGFFSFLPTDYVGLAELGLISGASMFIALIANLTVLPALLRLMKPTARIAGRPRPASSAPAAPRAGLSPRTARLVVLAAALVGTAAVPVAVETRFDFDPLNLKDPETESVGTILDLIDDPATSPYRITVLTETLDAATALGQRLRRLDVVDHTRTLTDLVPDDQDAKLMAIDSVAMLMQPLFSAPTDPPPPDPAARRAAWEAFTVALARPGAANMPGVPALRQAVAALQAMPGGPDLATLETRLLGGFAGRLGALLDSLEPEPVTLDSLPARLRALYVAEDGRARLDVYPAEDVRDREALERFVTAVRDVAPRATGTPVTILEAGDTVVQAFVEALVLSVGLIALLLVFLLRSPRDTILVFVPLALAAGLTLAASVLLGMPLNFANVIVLPLLFGLGVAGAIHFVLRERDQHTAGAMLQTTTPRAVVLSALTTIGSFGSIALSSHPGTASMGVLLTVALIMTLLCTLVVLPALMALLPRSG